jgi:hypothetical protein
MGYYFNLNKNADNQFALTVNPFTEKDIMNLFDGSQTVEIRDLYIQEFGEDINSDKYYTENDFDHKIRLNDFWNFIFGIEDYSINMIDFVVEELNVRVQLKDECIFILYLNGELGLKDYLFRILTILKCSNVNEFVEIVSSRPDKFICIETKNMVFEVYDDFWQMQKESKLLK